MSVGRRHHKARAEERNYKERAITLIERNQKNCNTQTSIKRKAALKNNLHTPTTENSVKKLMHEKR